MKQTVQNVFPALNIVLKYWKKMRLKPNLTQVVPILMDQFEHRSDSHLRLLILTKRHRQFFWLNPVVVTIIGSI
jgi:hypothetical protein